MTRIDARLACFTVMAALATATSAASAPNDAAELAPFQAHYEAYWKSINVGLSDIQFKPDTQAGRYVYVWTIEARGIFRMLYSDAVTQTSWFSIDDGHARPHKYRGEQGSASVDLHFDWQNLHITGTSEDKPVDIHFTGGAQDLNSIQVECMLDLKNGDLPKTFQIIDKDQLKEFNYRVEGRARLRTEVGELDTVIVASQRTGNNRILRMWFAPTLGYMPVQAERTRDGKLEFAIRLKSYSR